jgi:signal transduction histidine kinase
LAAVGDPLIDREPRRLDGDAVAMAAASVLVALCIVAMVWAAYADHHVLEFTSPRAESLAAVVSASAVNALLLSASLLIVWQQRRHAVGWVLLAFCCLAVIEAVAEQLGMTGLYVPGSSIPDPGGWAALSEAIQRPEGGLILLLLLLFPTGRLPAPRWRVLLWAIAAVFTFWFVVALLKPVPLQEDPFTGLHNPLGQQVFASAVLRHSMTPLAALVGLGCLASLVVRYRSSTGEVRQQLRWVGFAAATLPLCLVAVAVASLFGTAARNAAGESVWVVLGILLPASIVVAVTRYRLYDLDLIVNRTVVYGSVSLIVVAVYAVVVLAVTGLVASVGWTSPAVVALATLTAAATASPAHARMQDLIDRRFHRRAWSAARQIESFARLSKHELQPASSLREVLASACADPTLQVGYWLREQRTYTDGEGSELVIPKPDAPRSVSPVNGVDGDPVAVLIHGRDLDRDPGLLDNVVDAAGLLLENARLQAELQMQLLELRRASARIVRAADEERHRVGRDLHDGAQQRLVGLALQVKLAQRSLNGASPAATEALEEISGQVHEALAELRDLARGLHPAALDEGLGPALEAVTSRLPVDVYLDVDQHRLPALLELTGYYVACEAVTNAIKHADATEVGVSARHAGGVFSLRIVDNGRGGARATSDSGLTGLVDRVNAVGGTLTITSPPGEGTTLVASLPCGC